MLKFIIGTIGDMDAPMNPSSKGIRSFSAYISNYTIEDFKKEREEVLTANAGGDKKISTFNSSRHISGLFMCCGKSESNP